MPIASLRYRYSFRAGAPGMPPQPSEKAQFLDGNGALPPRPAARQSGRGAEEWRRNSLKSRVSRPAKVSLEALFGERCEDIARTGAGEGGGDVGAGPEAPVRPLAVGAGQIGRDRLADQIVELGVGEDRARAANQRMDSRRRHVVERRVLGGRRGHESGRDERGDERSLLLAPRRDRLARGRKGEEPERQAFGDVGPLPPAGERREIVRRDAGD